MSSREFKDDSGITGLLCLGFVSQCKTALILLSAVSLHYALCVITGCSAFLAGFLFSLDALYLPSTFVCQLLSVPDELKVIHLVMPHTSSPFKIIGINFFITLQLSS